MEDKFVPYEEALRLKELGFDMQCLAYYRKTDKKLLQTQWPYMINHDKLDYVIGNAILAPIWQDAFDWFREEHGYFSSPTERDDDYTKQYDCIITKNLGYGKTYIHFLGYHNSYQEAQLACLDKLIEILENEK